MPDGRKPLIQQAEMEIVYPPEILAKLALLPKAHSGAMGRTWAPWEDDLIKNHWLEYNKSDLSELIGVSRTAIKNRQRKLSHGGA